MKRVKLPGHYYGLKEIGARIGCSTFGVRAKVAKLRFPAFHVPSTNPAGGYGYEWYTNEWLINQWSHSQIQESRNKFIASKTGKRLAYTREQSTELESTGTTG